MLSPFDLSAQHMPVIIFILTNACYFSSGDIITRAGWTLISPTPQRQPLGKDLQSQRKVIEASTQHLLLVSLCVHTQMNNYVLRERTRGKRQHFEWILSWGAP